MKKILLTMVATMALTFCYAETKTNSADKRFDMSCNMERLSTTLELDEWQEEEVEAIHNSFSNEMLSLATLKGPRLRHRIHQALQKDAWQMRRVLNDKQLNTYMRVMVATLRNRNL